MKSELEFLNQIKGQLLESGRMKIRMAKYNDPTHQVNVFVLEIDTDDWHRIFKTDEFNERNHEREV